MLQTSLAQIILLVSDLWRGFSEFSSEGNGLIKYYTMVGSKLKHLFTTHFFTIKPLDLWAVSSSMVVIEQDSVKNSAHQKQEGWWQDSDGGGGWPGG